MFNLSRLTLAAAALVLAAAPLQAQTPDSAWQQITNPVGRFAVLVPAPLSDPETKTDAAGITTHTYVARVGRTAYVIVYADNASTNVDGEMDDARNALLKGLSAVMVAEHRFRSRQPVGETPAAEVTGYSATMGAEVKARTFWYKSRLYMIGVVAPTGSVSMLDFDKFLASFKITS
jgi:hypothetical protein